MSSTTQTLGFGSGIILAAPNGGNLAPNPTPVEIGVIQNLKLTISGDIKTLYGQNQYPVDSAVGKRAIKGSFEQAQITGLQWNQLFFADTEAAGVCQVTAYREPHTIPGTSPYTVTVTNSTYFTDNWGVFNATTGNQLTDIGTGTPTTGQYTVSAGVYTFAAADEGMPVFITYRWMNSALGNTFNVNNHVMGYGPIVSMDLIFPYQGAYQGIYLPNVRIGKLDLSTKLDDYTMMQSDFEAFANAAGLVMQYYLPY